MILATRGLNFGIDFTGGTLIEVSFPGDADTELVRDNLRGAGLGDAVVQTFGAASDIVVRMPPRSEEDSSAEISTLVLQALQQGVEGEVVMRRVEFVGPQVGDELTEQGILAVVYALIGILLYVMIRFQWRFSVGAVAALVHDVHHHDGHHFAAAGRVRPDRGRGAAGGDRLLAERHHRGVRPHPRELPAMRKSTPVEVINASLNQTLSRTLMTSCTTLLVLVALFIFGGEIIHGFAFTLIIGVVVGTYSSIYVASAAMPGAGCQQVRPAAGGEGGRGGPTHSPERDA